MKNVPFPQWKRTFAFGIDWSEGERNPRPPLSSIFFRWGPCNKFGKQRQDLLSRNYASTFQTSLKGWADGKYGVAKRGEIKAWLTHEFELKEGNVALVSRNSTPGYLTLNLSPNSPPIITITRHDGLGYYKVDVSWLYIHQAWGTSMIMNPKSWSWLHHRITSSFHTRSQVKWLSSLEG